MFVNSYHQITITGKVVKDPELHFTDKGVPIIRLSIPTNNVFRNLQNEVITETTWFEVILQNATAEAADKKLKKNDHIQVIGRLKPEVKVRELKNGKIIGVYEVICDEAVFIPKNGYKHD